nr:MAG TPA: hypothetical protein [Caudoviricetes sp.]
MSYNYLLIIVFVIILNLDILIHRISTSITIITLS